MQFKLGDKIRFLNDVGEGTITQILSSQVVMVECQDGFDHRYVTSDLVLVAHKDEYNLDGIEHVESVKEKIEAEKK